MSLVEQAIAGTLKKEAPQAAASVDNVVPELDSYPDDLWEPVFDYVPFDGGQSCGL